MGKPNAKKNVSPKAIGKNGGAVCVSPHAPNPVSVKPLHWSFSA